MRPSRTARATPRHVAAVCLAALVCAVALGACGDDGSSDSGGASSTTRPVAIGDSATVTATTAPATSSTVPAPVGRPDPHEAAKVLYDAWKAGDRTTAATVADPMAVDGMWQTAPGDYALYNQCNTGEFGSSACLYRGDAGTIQFAMEQRATAWVVVEAVFSPA